MKTRCPACATTFRVNPEQLKARAGKVRCGKCDSVFNALDTLIEEVVVLAPPSGALAATLPLPAEAAIAGAAAPDPSSAGEHAQAEDSASAPARLDGPNAETPDFPTIETDEASPLELAVPADGDASAGEVIETIESIEVDYPDTDEEFVVTEITSPDDLSVEATLADDFATKAENAETAESPATGEAEAATTAALEASAPAEASELADPTREKVAASDISEQPADNGAASAPPHAAADGGVLPRQMTEIPGYSKWSEGAIAGSAQAIDNGLPTGSGAASSQTAFVVVAVMLALLLAGQTVFHFRSEIAASAPSLRRALVTYADLFGAALPPLRHAEQISIEGSDLQADPARSGQLLLLATLANRAPYAQALPLLELTLTDTHDQAVARKVFPPEQYLPDPAAASAPFAPRSEIALRLPIETRDIAAAGYRLYVFYP